MTKYKNVSSAGQGLYGSIDSEGVNANCCPRSGGNVKY